MSLGNHIYKFITHLPPEPYITLIPQTEKADDISLFYSTARMWEGLQKISQKLATSGHWQGPSKYTRKLCHPFPSSHSTTTMPHLSNGASTSSTTDPMDLDTINISCDPCKPSHSVRCYNCNLFDHLARNCPWPPRWTPSGPVSTGRTYHPGHTLHPKSFRLIEEIGEVDGEGKEEVDEEYHQESFDPNSNSNSSTRSSTFPTEYDPRELDLQLQYLDNEVNLMEIKKYLEKKQKKQILKSTKMSCSQSQTHSVTTAATTILLPRDLNLQN